MTIDDYAADYGARIILDSINPWGKRLTTYELRYPRFIHAEVLTHRVFSRNSSSSRAIPVKKMIDQVLHNPALPLWWGKNEKGMQAREELTGTALENAKRNWLLARDEAVTRVMLLNEWGLHKQLANRLLEPWMFITVLVSATEYGNWFHLRSHPDAQPEIKWVSDAMATLHMTHQPTLLQPGEWHLPFLGFPGDEALDEIQRKMVSVGRCCRVSYLTHNGERDVQADIDKHNQLKQGSGGVGHWSPFEHVARALDTDERTPTSGNFIGWEQYRKLFREEHHARIPWEEMQ